MKNPFRRRRTAPFGRVRTDDTVTSMAADVAVGNISGVPVPDLHAWVIVTCDKDGQPRLTVRGCPRDHVQLLAIAALQMTQVAAHHDHGSES